MERRALVVGIDHYQQLGNDLACACTDAKEIARLLRRHEDGTPNYDCRLVCDAMEDGRPITRPALREACRELFADFDGDVLLYFSGHGVLTEVGGYLCTADATPDDWGIPMEEVVQYANQSRVHDILLILDCCHSGDIANPALLRGRTGEDPLAVVREDMTVLAASRPPQPSLEAGSHGLFTAAVIDALDGGAADHLGFVTAPAIYNYAERRFGAFDQRPVYKSYATRVTVVRQCAPLIERLKLRELVRYFPSADAQYALDPECEPEDEHGNVHEPVNVEKVTIARRFKEYRDAGLLQPVVAGEQLYWTARRGHSVRLTRRGREYWRLVALDRI